MIIENAKHVDLSEILKLQKLCFREAAERLNAFDIPPLMQTLQQLEAEHKTFLILKASEENEIVGSIRAYVKDDTCFILRVIVSPKFQNRSIGKKLMSEMENRFKHVKRFELFTGSLDEKNLYFYQSIGYKPFKEERQSEKLTFVYLEKVMDKA
jgi:ribosomal protein S18 acetylase RimI-like enzyme